ncbi:MAG: 13E12 repeat family protein, partial [Promicromonosporaceae bacterium]|nr:13E12 repeat family protein [Promicromonosporaceae bacterium]
MVDRIEQSEAWFMDPNIAAGKFATWLAKHDGIAQATANAEVRTLTKLEHLPETQRRYLAGEVNTDQVRLMCTIAATSEPRLETLANPVLNWKLSHESDATDSEGNSVVVEVPTGEAHLLDIAASVSMPHFQRAVRNFAQVADPEADERGYRKSEEREYFQLSETLGGYHVTGFLTEEHGQMLKIAIENLVDAELNQTGNIVIGLERRTRPQRRADAVAKLAQLAMDT